MTLALKAVLLQAFQSGHYDLKLHNSIKRNIWKAEN